MEKREISNSILLKELPKIVQKHSDTQINSIRFIGSGSNGKAFKAETADGAVVLKAYRTKGDQEIEAKQLCILAKNTSVKIPEVYFTYEDNRFSVLCMDFIPGQNVLNPLFLLKSKAQKEAFANEVISGLSQLHSVKGEKYGNLENPTYTSWLEYYNENKIEPQLYGLKKLTENGKFPKKNLELLKDATRLFNEIITEPNSPALIHGDINIMNIMADPKTLKLNGFIDPSGAIWADREYDLFQLLNMWGNSFGLYNTYKKMNTVSQHCDFKTAYYGALNEASCRLGNGLIMPVWEIQCNHRLKKALKRYI